MDCQVVLYSSIVVGFELNIFGLFGRVNFKKNEKTYDAEKSAVFKVLQEEASDPEPGMLWMWIVVLSLKRTEIPVG